MSDRHQHNSVLWLAALAGLLAILPHPAARADYRQKALEQTVYIQAHFYDPAAKKYHDTYPINPHGLPWTTMWANGVQWRVLVEAAQDEPAVYRPVLDSYGQGIQDYWDPLPKGTPPGYNAYCSGPGGNDKYYDDNAWMVLGYLEAYQATHDPIYLQRARDTQAFVLSGWDETLGGGIYWSVKHLSKNTCVNAPAAVGALRFAELGDRDQLEWGTRLVNWVNATLEDRNGLYWDNIALGGKITNWEFTYNAALMIEAEVLLSRTPGNEGDLQAAERSADAAIAAWQDPKTGAFTNNAEFTHLLCEALLQLYQADHNVRYLNAVRRHATYAYRYARDPQDGGYWDDWTITTHQPGERKSLLESASDARLFWLLAPYPDVDQLYSKAIDALDKGNISRAQDLLQQAADSDTEAAEPRYHLWRLLLREHKENAAAAEEQQLVAMSANPKLLVRLTLLGWSPAASEPPNAASTKQ